LNSKESEVEVILLLLRIKSVGNELLNGKRLHPDANWGWHTHFPGRGKCDTVMVIYEDLEGDHVVGVLASNQGESLSLLVREEGKISWPINTWQLLRRLIG